MAIAITSVIAIIFFILYVSKLQDCTSLRKDNQWLKEQRENSTVKADVNDIIDGHPLDQESAMEAIRYNGFIPESDGNWISFMSQGERFIIDAGRFPVMVMMKHYGLDHKDYDMELMHKAAHQVSDDLIMGKVLFTGDEEDGIAFQITSIENKFGHFKDSLTRYISIIEESQARMSSIYNEMDAKRKEAIGLYPQLRGEATGEKKMLS